MFQGREIRLKYISAEGLFNRHDDNKAFLYGDFNVLNHLYETHFQSTNNLIVYPDSSFVYLILTRIFRIKFRKIVSTDLLYKILNDAAKEKKSIFFFGDSEDMLSQLKHYLQTEYPELRIAGFRSGYNVDQKLLFNQLNLCKPDILFVGLGACRQESWIVKNHNLLNIPYIFTTGGWFRYLAGINKRAPEWMLNLSLEWLYKLLTEFPRVWKRYFITAPSFLFKVLTKRIILKLDYENTPL